MQPFLYLASNGTVTEAAFFNARKSGHLLLPVKHVLLAYYCGQKRFVTLVIWLRIFDVLVFSAV